MEKIYINVATINNFNEVLNYLLNKINESGLYDKCWNVYIIVNGDTSLLEIDKKEKYIVYNANKTTDVVEFPSLHLLWLHSNEIIDEDYNILYLHTKGVTKPNSGPVKDWTEYMSYFNIEKWQDRIMDLKNYDTTGVNLSGNVEDYDKNPETWGYTKSPLHYSGNFWWSKSSYIKNLPNPYDWKPDKNYLKWRVMCEMWLCQNKGNFYNAWASRINHYMAEYPRSNYTS
jgi:hypothetical protein